MRIALGGVAGAVMLATLALPGTAEAAQQEPGVYKQTVGEEFGSQRRYYRRRYYVRRYWPRYYGYYGGYWPSYYGYYGGYPYFYSRPHTRIGFGRFWGW